MDGSSDRGTWKKEHAILVRYKASDIWSGKQIRKWENSKDMELIIRIVWCENGRDAR